MSSGTSLIRARTPTQGVKDLKADDNQILKIVQCDEDGEVLGDGTKQLKIISKDITTTDLTDNAYTFTSAVDAVAVKNDGTSDLTVTISTLLFTLKPGESRVLELAQFSVVTFSAGALFRMNGLRRV